MFPIISMIFVAIFAGLVGLAFCFFGYQLFRIILPIWAFFIGLWAGMEAVSGLFGAGFLSGSLGLIVGFGFGLLLACIAYFVYSLAVVIFGATVGFALGQGFILLFGFDKGPLSWTVGVIVAVVFAGLFVLAKFPKIFIIILTAFAGAMVVISGVLMLFGVVPDAPMWFGLTSAIVHNSFLWSLVWIVLAVLGMVFQYALSEEKEALMNEMVDANELMVVSEVPATTKK